MASDHRHKKCCYQRPLEPSIWRACAGNLVHIPAVHSRVYYFPQGHMEQASGAVAFSPLVTSRPHIPCRVLQVSFLADVDTDEVFAKFSLEPLINAGFLLETSGSTDTGGDISSVVSFAKVLTPSDANNGGGFSVPRFCADSVFPPLDFNDDPPVQNIRITDVHGEGWDFRHIYRGTPRRHLLTTGWSKFVNSKKLIAGDTVVFIRNKLSGQLFVGIRRALKFVNDVFSSGGSWPSPPPSSSSVVVRGGFSRKGKGRVPPELVVEAAEKAAKNLPFEVVYYPRAGLPEFVVAAEMVDGALNLCWSSSVRIKMATETEDSSRLTWFNGTVASVSVPDNGPWQGSCWRMLQVLWDEPDALQNMKTVSPWKVEIISTPNIRTAFSQDEKLKGVQYSGLLTDGNRDFPIPSTGFSLMMGQLSSSYLNHHTFPAGMQGARQNPFFVSSFPIIMNDGTRQVCPDDYVDNASQEVEIDSIDPIIGGSHSDTPSPDSQNSVQFFGMAGGTEQRGITSFQLFGQIIQLEQPLTNTDTRNNLDRSLSDPYNMLQDGLGAQGQRSSVMGAYTS